MGNKLHVLGPKGSFSWMASQRLKNFDVVLCKNFDAVFKHIHNGKLGLVPVRNKIIGPIEPSSSFLKKGDYKIQKKIRLPINFALCAGEVCKLEELKKIYAPVQAFEQCSVFLRGKSLACRFARSATTSAAYKKIVQLKNPKNVGAIGSEEGAKLFGLKVIAKNIQDDPEDWTEFAVVRKAAKKF